MSQGLTINQVRAISALLEYPKIQDAAAAIGVNRKTITRWLEQEDFRAALHQAEGLAVDEASRKLLVLSNAAIAALYDVLKRPEQRGAANKRLAAVAMLDQMQRLRERHTTEERLAALEMMAYGEKYR